jgi:CubicO group peptidase (beta-lactamase class C family)
MQRVRPALCTLLLAAAAPLAAQLPHALPESAGMSAARLARIRPALEAAVRDGEVAGVVTMIARNGKLVEVDSAGYADREAGAPMRPATLFRLASMTKAVTSVAAMILVEEGKLLLSDPLSRYIPAFREMRVAVVSGPDSAHTVRYERARRQITIRDLLTHRSGLAYGFGDTGPVGDAYRAAGVSDGIARTDLPTMAENVERLARQPLLFQPGSQWNYGLNTDVLGRVVEIVSGKSLSDFMQARIFNPLQLHDTFFWVPDEQLARVTVPYRPDSAGHLTPMAAEAESFSEGRLLLAGKPTRGSRTFFSGGAGLVGTAGDYLRFLQMLANGGTLDGVGILGRKTVELMTESHTGDLSGAPLGPGVGFGLGFLVVDDPGKTGDYGSPGTFSWGGIYGTNFWVDPKERLVAVMMIQRFPTNGIRVGGIFRSLAYQAIVN